MKKQKLSLLALPCCLLCSVCGCTPAPPHSGAGDSAPSNHTSVPPDTLGLRLITSTYGLALSPNAGTDNGYYEIITFANDINTYLTYYDYATRRRVYLSSDASSPRSENSTACLGDAFGGWACFTDGEQLYLYKRGNQLLAGEDYEKGRPYFLRMGLNGANPQRLDLPVTHQPGLSSGIVRDKTGALYFTLYYLDNTQPIDEMEKCMVAKADFETQTLHPLVTLPGSKTEMRIRTVYGDALVIEKIASNLDAHERAMNSSQLVSKRSMLLLNVRTGEEELLFHFADQEIFSGSMLPYQNKLYYMKTDDRALYAYSLDTRQETVAFPCIGPEDDDCTVRIYDEIRDGKMQFLAEYPDGASRVLAVDLATGETFTPSLTVQLEDGPMFVGIFAESPEYFFVYAGKSSFPITAYGNNGQPFQTQQGYMIYKLIKKDDYWHSRPNYLDFDDHVLPP